MPFPIIVTPSAAGTGVSLETIRNRLADELGFRIATTVTDTGDTQDAARVVIADELRDDEVGYDNIPPWLYAVNGAQAGKQRRVVSQPGIGYQGPMGGLVTSRPFDAALQVGTAIEVTGPLPIKRHLGILGLNDVTNQALPLINVSARLTVTGNGTYEYDLSAFTALEIADLQVQSIDDTYGLVGTPAKRSPQSPRIVTNGASRTLVTDVLYGSADTFYLNVVVPADRLIFDGTSWAYATVPGLLGDAYQTAAPSQWVHVFSMVKALQQVRKMLQMRPNPDPRQHAQAVTELQMRLDSWARAAVTLRREQFPRVAAARTEPMILPPSVAEWV